MAEWIDVGHSLPNDMRLVLVVSKGGFRNIASLEAGEWLDLEDQGISDVTHWMPLPPPPCTTPERSAVTREGI